MNANTEPYSRALNIAAALIHEQPEQAQKLINESKRPGATMLALAHLAASGLTISASSHHIPIDAFIKMQHDAIDETETMLQAGEHIGDEAEEFLDKNDDKK
jgi:hypothetical protein